MYEYIIHSNTHIINCKYICTVCVHYNKYLSSYIRMYVATNKYTATYADYLSFYSHYLVVLLLSLETMVR